jgi:hypothetical protein
MLKSLLAWRFFFYFHNLGLFHFELEFLKASDIPFMPINNQHGVYTLKSFVLGFLWALSKHFKSILHDNASTSHVYSILVHESTNWTMKQHLIIYCCYLGFQGGIIKWHLFWRSWLSRMPHEKICLLSCFFIGETRLGFIKIGSPCY